MDAAAQRMPSHGLVNRNHRQQVTRYDRETARPAGGKNRGVNHGFHHC